MIHASDARLRAILRASPAVAVAVDHDGSIRYVSPSAEALFARSTDELYETCFWDLVHPDDLTVGLAVLARGIDHRGRATLEWRVRDGAGRWRWVEMHVEDMTDNEAVGGLLCHLTDIGGRRELEDALSNTEERFEDIFANQPLGAALFGPDLVPISVSPALCRMLGRAEDELVGRRFTDFTHPDDVDAGDDELAQLLDGELDRCQVERRYLRPDGSELAGRWTVWVSRDDTGEVRYGVATLEDVTDQVRTHALLEDRERHLRLALSAAHIAIWDIDLRTGVAQVYSPSRTALPVEDGSLVTTREHLLAVLHPDDRRRFKQVLAAEDPAGDDFDFECRIRPRAASESRWVLDKGQEVRNRAGAAVHIAGVTMDIDDRRRAEDERLEQAEVFRQTIDASNDAFLGLDAHGRIVHWNPAATRLLGYESAEVLDRSVVELLAPERSRPALLRSIERLANPESGFEESWGIGPVELELVDRRGRTLLVELSGARVHRSGGVVLHLFLRDATDRRTAVAQLEEGALTDALTGLPNRALLRDRLESAIARLERSDGMVAVFFLDLDRFKVVNDSLGHEAGDVLLANVASRIQRELRPQDTVARFGGDEFVVVAEAFESVEDILALAQRLVDGIGWPFIVRSHQFHLGASIGIAVATDGGADASVLIRDADLAMYRAKRRGGSGYELFNEDMRRAAMARLDLEADLRRAMDEEQLEVYYQPVVHFDGTIAGVEALVRWHHPIRGLISPAEFVPLAEETGQIAPLGSWVLETACRQVATWRQELAPELYVSVNLSVLQLADRSLPDLVASILERTGLAPDALVLELTETALMHDATSAVSTLQRLDAMGASIAVDDFGTGYSSLLYLRRFPVSALKLDRYFVAGVARDEEDRVIVGAIIDLAHALEMSAVAEGVEDDDQRDALAALGCDYAQGHLFGRALPAAALEQALGGDVLSVVTDVESPMGPSLDLPVGACTRDQPYRVVLVDDSPGDRSLLRLNLQRSGEFTVVGEAEVADEGLEVVARAQPDLVLVDLFLPGADGIELLDELHHVAPLSRTVIVSGFVSDGVAMAAQAAGALACLDKSLSPTSMLQTLTSLMAGTRAAAS